MIILNLRSSFSSAHLYYQPNWSDEKNRGVFGRCFTEHGHGHNYTLEVGFMVDSSELDKAKDLYLSLIFNLTDRLDHQHLNFDIAEFKNAIPTTENMALYFLDQLKKQVAEDKLSYVRLYETNDIWTEIKL